MLNTRFYWQKILVIGCQYDHKQSQDFRYYQKWIFRADFLSKWSRNMTKILPCRFKQSCRPFNMLTIHKCSVSSLKFSDATKTELFEQIFFKSNQIIWQKYRLADLRSLLDLLTCWLSISILTQRFLTIELTVLFAAFNFRKKSALRLIFLLKLFQILCRLHKWKKKIRKYF